MSFTCVVLLTRAPGQETAFETYERQMLAMLRAHGGEMTRRLAVEGDAWDELHELTFPTRDDFDAFLEDPARAALSATRDACIQETQVLFVRPLAMFKAS